MDIDHQVKRNLKLDCEGNSKAAQVRAGSLIKDKSPTQCSAYPHQPCIDTLYVLPPRRHKPKLVLTGTTIP